MDVVSAMRVGTASVNWGFDPYYTWAQTPPFNQMLDEMAQAGYEGTEISYNFPEDIAVVRWELERRNLYPASTFHTVNVRDPSQLEEAIASTMRVADRLEQLGSDVLILSDEASPERIRVAGRVQPADELSNESWRAMADGLKHIAERLAQRGMRAAFHPHVGTYVETRAEIDRLCSLTDPSLLALCPDTGHLAYGGAIPEDVFSDYAGRIGYVHLKDIDPQKLELVRDEQVDFVSAVRMRMFVELGTGMVPIPKIIEALRSASYSGWIVVEQDAPADPLTSAKNNRRYLAEHFAL